MGRADFFLPGSWNGICDVCAGKFKAEDLVLQWDNARVCLGCYSPRHPQDFVRPIVDPQPIPWSRPDQGVFKEFATTRVIDAWVLDSITMG
jgi:hypothetical protein